MKSSIIIKVAAVFFSLSSLHTVSAQRLVAPFSGKLPSEIYLASLSPENSPSGITTNEHNILFAPAPPPGIGNGGGDTDGAAPMADCLWAIIFCFLAYGIYCRKNV
jgi:hypothetical protein